MKVLTKNLLYDKINWLFGGIMKKILLTIFISFFILSCDTGTSLNGEDDKDSNDDREPGLYIGDNTVPEKGVWIPFNLANALSWLSINSVSNTQYTIILGQDQFISTTNLNTTQLNNVSSMTIIIKGKGSEKTIQLLGNGALFTIGNSIALTLSKNITLKGVNENTSALIRITGGVLNMEEDAKISNNSSTSSGGGVYLSGGTFNMTGGTITNNRSTQYGGGILISSGIFNMYSGKITNNFSGEQYSGGAICIPYFGSGTINIYNGEISENSSNWGGGGISLDGGTFNMIGGTITKNTGKNGAGILTEGRTNIRGGNITGNFGIIGKDILTKGTLIISDDCIIGNIAIYGYGLDDNPSASDLPFITIGENLLNSNQIEISLTLYDKDVSSIKNNWVNKIILKNAVGYNGALPLNKIILKEFISWDGNNKEMILNNYHIDSLNGTLVKN
jgi:hypothetical protein